MAKKARTDAERRTRQCERLSRLLRVLHLIMGSGRWDAEALAVELECSRRTVHRLLQTLSMAGVPWYFDEARQAYRVRHGFKFPGFELSKSETPSPAANTPRTHQPAVEQLIKDSEAFIVSLRSFLTMLKKSRSAD